MSRILKRPMFRKGGPTNEGVMSMVVPKRAGYQSDGSATTVDNYTIDPNDPLYKDAMKRAAMLLAFAGPGRSQSDRLSSLLIRGGLKTMSQRPRGGLLPTLATAFEQPVDEYLKTGEAEDAFRRQIKLTGLTGAISSAEAKELQRMKLQAEVAKDAEKLKLAKEELFTKSPTGVALGSASKSVFNTLEDYSKNKIPYYEKPLNVNPNTKRVDSKQVEKVPIGMRFFDLNGDFYVRTEKGYKPIYGTSGEDVAPIATEKKPGFFEKSKQSGASYDPRSWNKQRFYEELGKKNTLSNM